MPTARAEAQRIAPGHISKSALLAGSYLLTGFTVHNDQKVDNFTLISWIPPMRESAYVPQVPQQGRVRLLGGKIKQDGLYTFQWRLADATFGMITNLRSTIYTSGALYSAPVTVLTYDDTDTAVALQCLIDPLILPGESGEATFGGWQNVLLNFVAGVIIT